MSLAIEQLDAFNGKLVYLTWNNAGANVASFVRGDRNRSSHRSFGPTLDPVERGVHAAGVIRFCHAFEDPYTIHRVQRGLGRER